MELIYILFMASISGFLFTIAICKLYNLRNQMMEQKEKEQLENEVIEGLIELKKYSEQTQSSGSKASDKYDLIELALENDLSDITIVSEEGLPIISTLRNPDELAAQYSALFEYARNSEGINELQRMSIKSEEGYKYITPMVKNGIPLYFIISSKVRLDSIIERILMKDLLQILDEYISENTDIEEEGITTTHIVKNGIEEEDITTTHIVK